MSNGSKEQEFPELSENAQERITSGKYCDAYREREDSLLEALAQIAALTAQVEELQADFDRVLGNCTTQHERALKSEAELALLKSDSAALQASTDKRAAELAALREGETVAYRVEFQWGQSKAWEAVPAYVGDCCHATLVGAENHMNSLKPNNTLRIVEVITRDRILDATEPNKGDQRDR